jgi:hypothetical protein
MLKDIDEPLNAIAQNPDLGYADLIMGAAIFDLSGLPKEYFTTSESSDISWVQTIFQAVGLQSLLISSLQLQGFQHALIHGTGYSAVVVKQKLHYTALLVKPDSPDEISQALLQWLQELEPSTLRHHTRFNSV